MRHVNIALQISHKQAVSLFRRVLSHNQVLIVRMHEVWSKPNKLFVSLALVDFPSIGVNCNNTFDKLLSCYTDQRTVNQVADASTDNMQLQAYSIQLL